MNKDFHYEGTYAAAILARFLPEDAAIIAWAAQTVDECTSENLDKYYSVYKSWEPVYTSETVLEDIQEEFSSVLSDETSSTLQSVRNIWMPFHFLPGNLDNHTKYEGKEALRTERDIRDFLCLCEPASPLVSDMINTSIRTFTNLSITERRLYLVKLGILMHVLADTWAHQHFTGSPNYLINEVNNLSVTDPVPVPNDFSARVSPPGPTNYSLSYLGHGRAGHYPDYGCMHFQYTPKWRESSHNNVIHKSNTDDFENAFLEMYYALYCHQYARTYSTASALALNEDWRICIRDIVSTVSSSQSHQWRQQLADFVDYKDLPEYTFADHSKQMNLFQSYAREHQSYVMGYVQRNGNILNT